MPPKKHKRSPAARRPARGRGGFSLGGARNATFALPEQISSKGFTMKDEARNTTTHQPAWGREARLRQQPVAFVSAGFTEPLKNLPKEQPDVQDADASELLSAEGLIRDKTEATLEVAEPVHSASIHKMAPLLSAEPGIAADATPKTWVEEPTPPARPLEKQNEEPVVEAGFFFDLLGDKSLANRRSPPPGEPEVLDTSVAADDSESSEDVVLFKGRANMAKAKALEKAKGSQAEQAVHGLPSEFAEGNPGLSASATLAVRNAAFQMQMDAGAASRSGDEKVTSSRFRGRSDGTRDDQDDEDALIADYIANMAQHSEEDSKEQHSFSLTRDLGGDHDAFNIGSELSASEQEFDSEDHEINDFGEADDEALARLLSKQEELGLGSDELVLFSDSYTQVEKQSKRGALSSRKASKMSHTLKEPFTSAAAVAEAFDNLDLADHNANVASTSKRRNKQAPTFDLSDSELEAKLQAAWYNDRERKKNRKVEREELRTQGLLGKNIDPDDLRVKYSTGMALDDIKAELKTFILGSSQTLQFPPMDKQARMMLHELAGKFKIKSQSTGKGDQRRPVLSRTKQTVIYAADQIDHATVHIESASTRIRRKYIHRTDARGRQWPGSKDIGGGRSGGKAVTYREGEIVGAAAPELGQGNRGRAMLEKMGWSKGMALGAFENQGILEPVAQVVKRSKAGLG